MQAGAAMDAPLAPRSPLKIQPEEFFDTPGSSATTSPAESCASDVAKLPKPWERTASMASSVNSTEAGEPLSEEDEPESSIVVENSTMVSTAPLRMQALMRGMHQRVDVLQRLMREASLREKQHQRTRVQAAEATLYRKCAQPTANNLPLELVPPSPAEWVKEASIDNKLGTSAEFVHAGGSANHQEDGTGMADQEVASEITMLLNQVKCLEAQLKEATDENRELKVTLQRLEEKNVQLQAHTTFNWVGNSSGSAGSVCGQESICDEGAEAGDGHDENNSRLTTAIFGAPSAFQMVMEEDLAVLKNHERCQHKLHELWDTIRTLKTFVETYEIERDVMRVQRDEAIADADRADASNVKLASSSNPQQKIKYLQQVKKDNQELRRKNRALNMRLAKQAAKVIREKNGCSELEDSVVSFESATLHTIEDNGEAHVARSSEEILRSMRGRSGVLEQRLEHLRLARQEVEEYTEEASGSELPTHSSEAPPEAISPRPSTSSTINPK
ncbi:unnamed protein product [Phytophthora fragariaefolia]|uniref:Unnamed protein product n=1 Tax=Phytophthora fragariaefolia TaxID=1490495 RepID=A0A9W7CWT0_9STRA|nr:unnamed protein product [Phytophthora fragariaefolia]